MSAPAIASRANLEAAIKYVALGLPVFPVWPVYEYVRGVTCGCTKTIRCDSPGKHPMGNLVPRGVIDASTNEAVIRRWWSARPDANIGIATGRGLIVIDIDPRHGGDESLREAERQHGALPPTWRVSTGGGGSHLYFAAAANSAIKNSAGLLGHGLDIRGRGGYVVAPPSRHISGRHYAWESAPQHAELRPLPTWLSALLEQPKPATTAAPSETWRALVRDGVSEGKRNDAVARLAGHLLRRYVDPHVTLELLAAWNDVRCVPPLSSDELRRTVDSIARRELNRRATP
jgi:hypothetical protein